MPSPPRKLLDLDEVAEHLGVSTQHVRNLINAKQLRAVNVGVGAKRYRLKVTESELSRFLSRNTVN